MSAKQVQEIFQYIQSNWNNLGSDKVLKQVQKYPQVIWQILGKLSSKLVDKTVQNAFSQMSFLLQMQKHQRSSKWLKEYMQIHDLAQKANSNYTVLDYLRPQKDRILPLISKIIEILKGTNKLRQELDHTIIQEDLLSKDLIKYKSLEQTTSRELQQLKFRKDKQLPYYEQKSRIKMDIERQINDKRNYKLEKLSEQRQLRDQSNRIKKLIQDLEQQKANQKFTIIQLKKQITMNAPEVKKQKRAIEQEYNSFYKKCSIQTEKTKARQRLAMTEIQKSNKKCSQTLEISNNLISLFQNLQEKRKKMSKQMQINQRLVKKRKELIQKQTQLKQKRNNNQNKLHQKSVLAQNLSKNYYRDQIICQQKRNKNSEYTRLNSQIRQRLNTFVDFSNQTLQSIKQLQQKFIKTKKEIMLNYQQFVQQATKQIDVLTEQERAELDSMKPYNNPELIDHLHELDNIELMEKINRIQKLQKF